MSFLPTWQNWGKLQVKLEFSIQNWGKLQVKLKFCHVDSPNGIKNPNYCFHNPWKRTLKWLKTSLCIVHTILIVHLFIHRL